MQQQMLYDANYDTELIRERQDIQHHRTITHQFLIQISEHYPITISLPLRYLCARVAFFLFGIPHYL